MLALAAVACGADRGGEIASAQAPPAAGEAPAARPANAPPSQARSLPGESAALVPEQQRRSPQHSAYSLVDNRLAAHVQRGGGLFVPTGSAGAAKYLRYPMQRSPLELRQQRDGQRVGRPTGKQLALHVPLTAAQAGGEQHLRVRANAAAELSLSAKVNGRSLDAFTLAPGWSTSALAVPAGTLRAGENVIELSARKGALPELAWLQVGGAAVDDEPAPIYDTAANALVLPEGDGLAYYVAIPDDAHLVGDVAGAGCALSVRAVPSEGAPITGSLQAPTDFVDLAELAGKAVRLELTAGGCASASVTGLALAVPGAEPAVTRGEPPRYLVLWIMDALRADRLRIINRDARPEVPTFEALAKTSAVFAHNYVQGNESRASHASIWTSLYPVVHDFLSARGGIDTKWNTVDELMKTAGLYTSGISANGYITVKRGFGTRWDQYVNLIHEGGGLTGDWILDKALATVEKRKDAPFFLYIGTIDTHATWRAKEPWLSRYDEPGPYKGRFQKSAPATDMAEVNAGNLKLDRREVLRIRALYDANVSYTDQILGTLLQRLDDWGIRDQTMIVITADHGDELFERPGVVGHAKSLRETLVHVPLIVHYPPLFPAGTIDVGTEVVDILPTIADAFGLAWDDQWQGESVLPLAHGVGAGYPRMSMASQYEHTHAGRIGRWKLVAKGEGGEQLFDVAADPDERSDLADEAPIERRLVADPLWLLRAHNRAWKKGAWGNAANTRAAFPADMGE